MNNVLTLHSIQEWELKVKERGFILDEVELENHKVKCAYGLYCYDRVEEDEFCTCIYHEKVRIYWDGSGKTINVSDSKREKSSYDIGFND